MTSDASPGERPPCPNCETVALGRFCHVCGQDNEHDRLSFRVMMRRVAGEISEADSRLWHTVLGMTRAPGRFCREYVNGHRADRFPPFRYLMVLFAGALLLSPWTAPPMDESLAGNPGAEVAYDLIIRLFHLYGIPSLFLAAGVLRLTSREEGLNYAEHASFVFFTMGHGTLLATLPAPLLMVDYVTFATTSTIVLVGFALVSAVQFYRGAVIGRIARMLLALVIYYGFSMFVGVLIVVGVMIHRQLTGG
jgi:hypothetical protein